MNDWLLELMAMDAQRFVRLLSIHIWVISSVLMELCKFLALAPLSHILLQMPINVRSWPISRS